MKKTKETEILACDICGAEEGSMSEKDKPHEVAIRECGICKKHVCEDDAFMITDRNGIGRHGWICHKHIRGTE